MELKLVVLLIAVQVTLHMRNVFATEPSCRENEQYKLCTACPGSCQKNKPLVCPIPCLPGCVCAQGFMRDDNSGACVPNEYCLDILRATGLLTTEPSTQLQKGLSTLQNLPQSVSQLVTKMLPLPMNGGQMPQLPMFPQF